jgi:uncharacterized repeat protein (TIGR03803 family)
VRELICILLAVLGGSVAAAPSQAAAAPTYTVLRAFVNGNTSSHPLSPVIFDSDGDLFGTASTGGNGGCVAYGSTGCGTIYELIPEARREGEWSEHVLYRFAGGDGPWFPLSGLIMDAAGDLFGLTPDSRDGAPYDCFTLYCGTAYELSPPSGPGMRWTFRILYRFVNGGDGASPAAGLTASSDGDLYGTLQTGGPLGFGAVFRLSPPGRVGRRWTETVLTGFERGGDYPQGDVVFDRKGDLFATTTMGGDSNACEGGCGIVFELVPAKHGRWTERVLYDFGIDTCTPHSDLVFGPDGDLYGTTDGCPALPGGVFRLKHPARDGGAWTEQLLVPFTGPDEYGTGHVVFDAAGDVFGTSENDGAHHRGTIFMLHQRSWTLIVLHSFGAATGQNPGSGPVFGPDGALYGTTWEGGDFRGVCRIAGCGVVYRLGP